MKSKNVYFNVVILICISIIMYLHTILIKIAKKLDVIKDYLVDHPYGEYLKKINQYVNIESFVKIYNSKFKAPYITEKSSSIYLYLDHLLFLIIFFFILIIFREKIIKLYDKYFSWIDQSGDSRVKNIFNFSLLIILFSFVTKAHSGVFFGGISGWDYSNVKPIIKTKIHATNLSKKSFYNQVINYSNLTYQKRDGYIETNEYFIHFSNGETKHFNLGILNMVFPTLQYNTNQFINDKKKCLFIDHLTYSLHKVKNENGFLKNIKYPNHTPYQKINYSSYPIENGIDYISLHKVYIEVKNNKVEVIGGKLQNEIKCQKI